MARAMSGDVSAAAFGFLAPFAVQLLIAHGFGGLGLSLDRGTLFLGSGRAFPVSPGLLALLVFDLLGLLFISQSGSQQLFAK